MLTGSPFELFNSSNKQNDNANREPRVYPIAEKYKKLSDDEKNTLVERWNKTSTDERDVAQIIAKPDYSSDDPRGTNYIALNWQSLTPAQRQNRIDAKIADASVFVDIQFWAMIGFAILVVLCIIAIIVLNVWIPGTIFGELAVGGLIMSVTFGVLFGALHYSNSDTIKKLNVAKTAAYVT